MGSRSQTGCNFLVLEDSPVFAMLATSSIRMGFPEACVRECSLFEDASHQLRYGHVDVLVCGYGLDGGRTAHDIRAICDTPMVILTGRPEDITPPSGSRVVTKMSGPLALQSAIESVLEGWGEGRAA